MPRCCAVIRERYLDALRAAEPASGSVALDADTHLSKGSLRAALRAVGGACAAVDAVIAGEVANAFVGCRPPGHHAEAERPMGFCLFGTAAIAAKRALDHHGLARVAVLDFDVHHGNGTQALLWDEERTLFVSSHQSPLWPGSGGVHETGAANNVINLPLAPGTGGAEMRRAWEREAFPALEEFAPELVIVSAGFDAHAADPLANLNWREADFAWITGAICDLAAAHAGGRVVSTLEGGYDLDALARVGCGACGGSDGAGRMSGSEAEKPIEEHELRGGAGGARDHRRPARRRRRGAGAVDPALYPRREAQGALRGQAAGGRGEGAGDHARRRGQSERAAGLRGVVSLSRALAGSAERIAAALAPHLAGEGAVLAAMRHALEGGKGLRGMLVLEGAALHGVAPERAVGAAAAIEAMHGYSLVHDDLPCMDDDEPAARASDGACRSGTRRRRCWPATRCRRWP